MGVHFIAGGWTALAANNKENNNHTHYFFGEQM
jgi:hypothetical protein